MILARLPIPTRSSAKHARPARPRLQTARDASHVLGPRSLSSASSVWNAVLRMSSMVTGQHAQPARQGRDPTATEQTASAAWVRHSRPSDNAKTALCRISWTTCIEAADNVSQARSRVSIGCPASHVQNLRTLASARHVYDVSFQVSSMMIGQLAQPAQLARAHTLIELTV